MDFTYKITADRPYQFGSELRRQLESDRGRIINSAAIRRLQQKTQVFPLERNSAVRSRLTHSMEVQQVGRYISQLICEQLKGKEQNYGLVALERELETIVEMSCLMHDVGNPPFGHFGEAALIDWLERNLETIYRERTGHCLPDEIERDLTHFEGNAQGIRLIHSLLQLNLTYSQASGILKYTRCGTEPLPDRTNPQHYLKKKVGYYLSEKEYINTLQEKLDIAPGCRSPFSYIMEAADDISYGIADLEDAVEKGVLTIEQLIYALQEEYQSLAQDLAEENHSKMKDFLDYAVTKSRSEASRFFVFLRVQVNRCLPQHASDVFIDNIEDIYHGRFNRALIEDNSAEHMLVKSFKNVAFNKAFCHSEVEARELQGYRVIGGLMECYKPLLQLSAEEFQSLIADEPLKSIGIYEKRLFKKLSYKHKLAYKTAIQEAHLDAEITNECREFYFRTRLIIDYISGMTDQFAYDEYRAFHVIDEF